MFNLKYSIKFYFGILLFLGSLVIGKITLAIFLLYFNNPLIKWSSLIIYILSWPMLIIGIWWIGKEYAKALKRYFGYKFYHQSLKSGAKTIIQKTRAGTERAIYHTKAGTRRAINQTMKIHSKATNKTKQVRSNIKNRLKTKRKLNSIKSKDK